MRRSDTEGYDTTQPRPEQEPERDERPAHTLPREHRRQLDIKALDNSWGLVYNEGDDAKMSSDDCESVV